MLVMGQIKLIKDFSEWKKMVQESGDIFAGTQANDNSILNTVIHFQSMEHFQKFQSDEELTRRRAEVVDVNSAVMTPISDTAFTNFPEPLTLNG